MVIIRARAPLRLGLAGGGTDVSPYCDVHGGYVLNATIDRYAYAVIKTLDENIIRFVATDQQVEQVKKLDEPLILSGKLDLHNAVYNEMIMVYNKGQPISLELSTFCDAPAGSGLGSSSTVVVVMIRAFVELLNLALSDYDIANLAFKIEREHCGLQGGRQDQYSATFGGFNFMEFYGDNRTIVNSLRIKDWIRFELESSLLLFYTGVSRDSAKIIAEQSSGVIAGHDDVIQAMHGIKNEALEMKEYLLKGDFSGMAESLRRGWESKKRSASSVTSHDIDEIYSTAISAGAVVGKVSGAGGGGFMLFLVPTDKRMNVVRALNKFNGYVSNCHFTKHGATAWRVQ